MNPIIHDYVTQIMVKHYKQGPTEAAEQAVKLLEIFELYGMQLVIGDWIVPEVIVIKQTPWDLMMETTRETMEREPWNAPELN